MLGDMATPAPARMGVPLRPDKDALRRRGAVSFTRACTAALYAANSNRRETPDAAAARLWPDEGSVQLLVKAASAPALTGTGAWAGSLASTATADCINSLGPASAGAALLRRGIVLDFERHAAIKVPSVLTSASVAGFVGEAAPIPVVDLVTGSVTISVKKLAVICAFTRELFEHSTPNVEAVVRAVLEESVGLSIDAQLLSASAGDAATPPGLLSGITPLTASAASLPSEAMIEDIAAVSAAAASVAGNSAVVLVMAPRQAEAVRFRLNLDRQEVLRTTALPDKTIAAIATNALVSATGPVPRVEASISSGGVLHFDTAPSPISTPGSPNVISAPIYSSFQTDQLSLRIVLEICWALRSSQGVAWIQNCTW
jgi:hypothetical protein